MGKKKWEKAIIIELRKIRKKLSRKLNNIELLNILKKLTKTKFCRTKLIYHILAVKT